MMLRLFAGLVKPKFFSKTLYHKAGGQILRSYVLKVGFTQFSQAAGVFTIIKETLCDCSQVADRHNTCC